MVVGILQFELHIPDSTSLKDKRRVVRSVKDRLHNEHMVSIAEVAEHETLNLAVLGLACVGVDGRIVGEVLDHVSDKLRTWRGAELGKTSREILTGDVHAYAADEVTDEVTGETTGETTGESINSTTDGGEP